MIHLKTAVREQRIISILESRGEMSVNELGAILNISVSTLRKQLADMQEKKLIIRTYGGVMSINPVPDETFDSKLHKNVNEKRRIATKARSLIKSGDSLSLGSGTTVYALSNLLDDTCARVTTSARPRYTRTPCRPPSILPTGRYSTPTSAAA